MAQQTKAPAKTKRTPATKPSTERTATASTAATETAVAIDRRKTLVGLVVSDKMTKTIVVKVDRQVRHGLYKKYLRKSRRFKAHDETNQAKIGDLVSIIESRPLSREKRWALQTILRKGGQAPEINV